MKRHKVIYSNFPLAAMPPAEKRAPSTRPPHVRETVAYQEITALSRRLDEVTTKALVAFANRCERRGLQARDAVFVANAHLRISLEDHIEALVNALEEAIYEEEPS